MNEDYCSYELALKLKKAGFDWPCDLYYTKEDAPDGTAWIVPTIDREDFNADSDCPFCKPLCSAPTLWHAQKWLREKAIEVDINPMFSHGGRDGYDWDVYDDFSDYPAIRGTLPFAETYEQALSAGISAALELIKKGE